MFHVEHLWKTSQVSALNNGVPEKIAVNNQRFTWNTKAIFQVWIPFIHEQKTCHLKPDTRHLLPASMFHAEH